MRTVVTVLNVISTLASLGMVSTTASRTASWLWRRFLSFQPHSRLQPHRCSGISSPREHPIGGEDEPQGHGPGLPIGINYNSQT